MKEQLFCSKCGKVNWSRWGETCECKEPDYRFESYDDYLAHEKEKTSAKGRDWQKDMELLQKPHKDIADVATILDGIAPYWHQEAEKWRFEAFRKYPTPDAYEAACAALHKHRERADKAEEREKVLKHAFIVMLGYVPKTARVALDFDEVLASLYPKEETK